MRSIFLDELDELEAEVLEAQRENGPDVPEVGSND